MLQAARPRHACGVVMMRFFAVTGMVLDLLPNLWRHVVGPIAGPATGLAGTAACPQPLWSAILHDVVQRLGRGEFEVEESSMTAPNELLFHKTPRGAHRDVDGLIWPLRRAARSDFWKGSQQACHLVQFDKLQHKQNVIG